MEEFTDLRMLLSRLYHIPEWLQASASWYQQRLKSFINYSHLPLTVLQQLSHLSVDMDPLLKVWKKNTYSRHTSYSTLFFKML
jgi:hypothetical protein